MSDCLVELSVSWQFAWNANFQIVKIFHNQTVSLNFLIYALQPSLAIMALLLIQVSFSHAYAANFESIRKTHFEWKTRWKFKGSENDNQIKKFMWFSEYLSKPQNLIYLNRTIEFSKQTKARVESFFSRNQFVRCVWRGRITGRKKKGNWIFTGIIFVDFCLRRDIDRCRMDLRLGIFSFHLLLFPSLWVSQILAFVYWKLLKVVTLDFVCWHDTDALNIFVEMKMCVQNLLLLCELKVVWTCPAREIPPPVPPLAVMPRSSWQFPKQILEINIFPRKAWIII